VNGEIYASTKGDATTIRTGNTPVQAQHGLESGPLEARKKNNGRCLSPAMVD
jgi:hypothetical protein